MNVNIKPNKQRSEFLTEREAEVFAEWFMEEVKNGSIDLSTSSGGLTRMFGASVIYHIDKTNPDDIEIKHFKLIESNKSLSERLLDSL